MKESQALIYSWDSCISADELQAGLIRWQDVFVSQNWFCSHPLGECEFKCGIRFQLKQKTDRGAKWSVWCYVLSFLGWMCLISSHSWMNFKTWLMRVEFVIHICPSVVFEVLSLEKLLPVISPKLLALYNSFHFDCECDLPFRCCRMGWISVELLCL